MKDKILNCTSTIDLLNIDIADASSLEKAIIDYMINENFFQYYNIEDYNSISLSCDLNGNFYITSPENENEGVRSSIEKALDFENWYTKDRLPSKNNVKYIEEHTKYFFENDVLLEERLILKETPIIYSYDDVGEIADSNVRAEIMKKWKHEDILYFLENEKFEELDHQGRRALAENENITVDMLKTFLNDQNGLVRAVAASNRKLSINWINKNIDSTDFFIRLGIAQNLNTSFELLEHLEKTGRNVIKKICSSRIHAMRVFT